MRFIPIVKGKGKVLPVIWARGTNREVAGSIPDEVDF
jgi:hypothetical protein